MNYYYSTDGKTIQGPAPLQQLETSYGSGGIPAATQVCAEGAQTWVPIATILQNRGVAGAPLMPPPPPVPGNQGDATGGIIPYKNAHALISYYLGVFGLIPFFGLLLAIPAVILGVSGLLRRKRTPIIRGAVHAWIGIVLGTISIGYHLLVIGLIAFKSH